jgi:molybdenum cofactor cytidylyltransferase
MGTQKLLLPFGNEPLVRRIARQICDVGFDDVLVVVGHAYKEVIAALEGLPLRHALNANYAAGMGTSFRTAIENLDADAAFFALADQPLLSTTDYRMLLDTYRQESPAIICVHYGDVIAPPHLFTREFFPELASLEEGARPLLQRNAARTRVLAFSPDLLLDVDTPEDYELARSRLTGL